MDILVEFDYEGKKYDGILSSVGGSGSAGCFHLYVRNRYCGILTYSRWGSNPTLTKEFPLSWKFSSQTGKLDHLQSFFVKTLNDAGITGAEYVP